MGSELLTGRLALRRLTLADGPNLLTLDGDPLVMRFLERGTKSLAEVQGRVLPRLAGYHSRHPGFGYWAAETRRDGMFVGWFGLSCVAPAEAPMVHWADAPGNTGVAGLGYRLRRAAWGQGYATEGARLMVHRAFAELGLREVVATTMAVNARSRRVMEKAGLKLVRTVHVEWADPLDGTEYGEVEYRLRRDEWRKALPLIRRGAERR